MSAPSLTRRALLAAIGASFLAPGSLFAATYPVRSLWLVRKETNEQINANYFRYGKPDPDAYAKICVLLRDVRAKQATVMDQELLDSLFLIQSWLNRNGYRQPMVVNSGYRTEKTNNSIEGAARNSLHLQGRAADIWVPGLSTQSLQKLAASFERGGVGCYPAKNFIHVDSGAFRQWNGA